MSGGAPKGNTNATKNKIWTEAIRKAIVQGKKLDTLAKKVVAMAEEGDLGAMKEIGDRLEGKPQANVNVESGDLVVQIRKFSDD